MADTRVCWRCSGRGIISRHRTVPTQLNDGSIHFSNVPDLASCEVCGGSGWLAALPSPQYVAPESDPA